MGLVVAYILDDISYYYYLAKVTDEPFLVQ